MISMMEKGAYPSINQKDVSSIKIPLPPLKIQKQIVEEIEREQEVVDSNKNLIKYMEQRIQSTIDNIWQSKEKVPSE